MGYIAPVNDAVSSSWRDHKNRTPSSREPGTDYGCAYGTPIRVAGAGVVTHVDSNNAGAEGRRVTVKLNDGRVVSYIHLSRILVKTLDIVNAGDFIAYSGASGFSQDWYYGPHVHVSLWEREGLGWADTIDFDKHVATETDKDEEMIVNIQGRAGVRKGGAYYIADGKATFLGGTVKGAPSLDFDQGTQLAKRVSGI